MVTPVPTRCTARQSSPPKSVHMDNTGLFYTCTGDSCLGNAAQGIPTLAYGQTMALGPFNCLSGSAG